MLAAVSAGDIVALRAAYDRHATLAWSLALRLVGDPACAEDVVQAAFLRLWRASSGIAGAGSVRSRIIALVTREALARRAGGSTAMPSPGVADAPPVQREPRLTAADVAPGV